MVQSHHQLDNIDRFNKNYAQAKAHVNSLTLDDHYKYVTHSDMSATLWAINDRLQDMEKTFRQVANDRKS